VTTQAKFYLPSGRASKIVFRRPSRGKLRLVELCSDGRSLVYYHRPYDFSAIIVSGWPIWRQSLRIPVDIEVPIVFGATDSVAEVERQAMYSCREIYRYLSRVGGGVGVSGEGTFHVVIMPSAGGGPKGTCTLFSILYSSRPVTPLFQYTLIESEVPDFLEYVTRPVHNRRSRFDRAPVI
jgi:hypothetical protein